MTRALGDLWSYNPNTEEYVISPHPDIFEKPIDAGDKFIIAASDGLWDVITPQRAVEYVWKYYYGSSSLHNPDTAAQYLIKKALNKKPSSDNISIIIAFISSPSNQEPPTKRQKID